METLSNNEIRNLVMGLIITDNSYPDSEMDDETRCHLCAEKIKNIELINNKIYKSILSIVYLDTYKVLNLKEKEISISYQEREMLEIIRKIASFDYLKDAIESDYFLLDELIKYFLEFYRMNPFRKIISYNAIDEATKSVFESDFLEFQNDIEIYYKNLNLDTIAALSKEQIDSFKDDDEPAYAYSQTLINLISFIKNLNRDNKIKYEKIIKEMIKIDYKWIKYITDNNYICDWLIDEELEYRIQRFEENNIKKLIEETILDNEYLEEILDSFLSIKCDNMGIDEKIINEELVEEHYKNRKRTRK